MRQKGVSVLILIVLIAALGTVGYFGYKYIKVTPPNPSPTSSANPQSFSFTCPTGWSLGDNLDYGGKVKLKECSLVYASQFAFDDGGRLTLGFVPSSIPQSERTDADGQIKTLKTFDNTTTYSNNGFEGWISMKNFSHTIQIIARKTVDSGYYEVTALGVGDTKTDEEYKTIFDEMISSFKVQ